MEKNISIGGLIKKFGMIPADPGSQGSQDPRLPAPGSIPGGELTPGGSKGSEPGKGSPRGSTGVTGSGKKFNKPKFARCRMKIEYKYGSAYYWSYDYILKKNRGVTIGTIRSEREGITKLITLLRKKSFLCANIFVNLSNDLDTDKNNYNYKLCTISKYGITWEKWISMKFDQPDNIDIHRSLLNYKLIKGTDVIEIKENEKLLLKKIN